MAFLANMPLILWTAWLFVAGACVGSLLNVCIARLPLEKSILWPLQSHCGRCLQPLKWYDNIPLISYWVLRGRCRQCGAVFSSRYFWVELLTACCFAGLFWLHVVANVQGSRVIAQNSWFIHQGTIPWQAWVLLLQRYTLLAFLIIVALCDLQSREIPLTVTVGGTLTGLAFSTLLPWPWPEPLSAIPVVQQPWWLLGPNDRLPIGAQLWPIWGPESSTLPFGRWYSGLANGVAGMLVGTFMLRGVRFVASRGLRREALGLGDADLMMMVGAFLGWQAVVAAFFAGALVALVIGVVQVVVFRDDSLPFGPGLAIGTAVVWVCWAWLGPGLQPLFFHRELILFVAGAGGVLMFALCWIMGRFRPADDAS